MFYSQNFFYEKTIKCDTATQIIHSNRVLLKLAEQEKNNKQQQPSERHANTQLVRNPQVDATTSKHPRESRGAWNLYRNNVEKKCDSL